MLKSIWPVMVLAAVCAIAIPIFKAWLERRLRLKESFSKRPLLTANELEFLDRLEGAAPELRFCPQVSMGALLEPGVPRSAGREYMRMRGRFSQKVVDFVAQSRANGSVVAIIELDDRTHRVDKDQARDSMLASAGYKVLRWDSRKKPDAQAIRLALFGLAALDAESRPA